MCDVQSFSSAYSSYAGGQADASMIKSRAKFEAAQMEVMGVLGMAEATRETADLERAYGEQAQANLAAMAVSGLSGQSFASVSAGNRDDLARNKARIMAAAGRKRADLDAQADLTRLDGQIEAAAARMSGTLSALEGLYDADQTYKKAHKAGDSRIGAFARSAGWDGGVSGDAKGGWNAAKSFFSGS